LQLVGNVREPPDRNRQGELRLAVGDEPLNPFEHGFPALDNLKLVGCGLGAGVTRFEGGFDRLGVGDQLLDDRLRRPGVDTCRDNMVVDLDKTAVGEGLADAVDVAFGDAGNIGDRTRLCLAVGQQGEVGVDLLLGEAKPAEMRPEGGVVHIGTGGGSYLTVHGWCGRRHRRFGDHVVDIA